MMRFLAFMLAILCAAISGTIAFDYADAAKTGSYNFCTQLPAYPECAGWRSESILDNHWFCEYVDLKNYCKNSPEPNKEIPIRIDEYCCTHIDEVPLRKMLHEEEIPNSETQIKNLKDSILPLVIWTDKDHYNYGEKVTIYGKFDFRDPTIIKNIHGTNFDQTARIAEKTFAVDIKLNGKEILRKVPVNPNGWFSAYVFMNNSYNFSTQYNLLEVEYIITSKDVPLGGPKTSATYHFTTGEIAQKESEFSIWLDDSLLPNKIGYGIAVENPERFAALSGYDLITTRLTTPEGYVIPIDSSFSGTHLSGEFDILPEYGEGQYELRVTYGDNISKKNFEYELE